MMSYTTNAVMSFKRNVGLGVLTYSTRISPWGPEYTLTLDTVSGRRYTVRLQIPQAMEYYWDQTRRELHALLAQEITKEFESWEQN